MEKEYDISEIFELEEGTKFMTIEANERFISKCKIIRGSLHVWVKFEGQARGKWSRCELTKGWVNARFKVIKKL